MDNRYQAVNLQRDNTYFFSVEKNGCIMGDASKAVRSTLPAIVIPAKERVAKSIKALNHKEH